MGILIPVFAPLGRLHEPLLQLAGRVHGALATRRKMVWTDDRGSVFIDDTGPLPQTPHAIVGIYDVHTPLPVIEDDLRLALRERASRWIIDWDKSGPEPGSARARPRANAAKRRGRRINRASLNASNLRDCSPEGSQPGM